MSVTVIELKIREVKRPEKGHTIAHGERGCELSTACRSEFTRSQY